MALDKTDFNPQRFFEDLIAEKSLSELLQFENQMSYEIRDLNCEMQTLVYENYNKFIFATDTIKKMKSNVEEMEEELKQLEDGMKKINECTSQIDQKVQVKHKEIKKLLNIDSDLKKVTILYSLNIYVIYPQHQNKHLHKIRTQKSWIQIWQYSIMLIPSSFLVCINQMQVFIQPAFMNIYTEAQEKITQIRDLLWKKIQTPDDESFDKYVTYLVQIDESKSKLAQIYLGFYSEKLQKILENFPLNEPLQKQEIEPPQNEEQKEQEQTCII